MAYEIPEMKAGTPQLAELLSAFKEVMNKYDVADYSNIEFTFVAKKSADEGSTALPAGCKYKCWYNQSAHSTQCDIVCSLG